MDTSLKSEIAANSIAILFAVDLQLRMMKKEPRSASLRVQPTFYYPDLIIFGSTG